MTHVQNTMRGVGEQPQCTARKAAHNLPHATRISKHSFILSFPELTYCFRVTKNAERFVIYDENKMQIGLIRMQKKITIKFSHQYILQKILYKASI